MHRLVTTFFVFLGFRIAPATPSAESIGRSWSCYGAVCPISFVVIAMPPVLIAQSAIAFGEIEAYLACVHMQGLRHRHVEAPLVYAQPKTNTPRTERSRPRASTKSPQSVGAGGSRPTQSPQSGDPAGTGFGRFTATATLYITLCAGRVPASGIHQFSA